MMLITKPAPLVFLILISFNEFKEIINSITNFFYRTSIGLVFLLKYNRLARAFLFFDGLDFCIDNESVHNRYNEGPVGWR
ncbi:hypothetical protein SAMN05518672_10873 [Chitinophaga sp. CF118]|nr:hypothetical protein SAMN05518672_10873 [Chitinophaga sp. CF118]